MVNKLNIISELKNKDVFITGASKGIGAAIAKRFAAEGANVIFTYVRSSKLAKEQEGVLKDFGVKSLAIQVDSANAEALKTAIVNTIDQFGPIDILVNNAGICPSGNFLDITGLIAFLAGKEGKYITGTILTIDAG
jgi:3-oxoacyl-[acyl-carrier protein] reductase